MTAAELAVAAARTARQIAEAAAREQREREAAAERQREVEKRAGQQRIAQTAAHLLEDSPLAEWFPGVQWQWADYPNPEGTYHHRYVVTPADEPRSFWLLLRREDQHDRDVADRSKPVGVFWTVYANQDGYPYWSGEAPVRSAAEIGEVLLQRQERRPR